MRVNYEEMDVFIQDILSLDPAQMGRAKDRLMSYGSYAVPKLCEVLASAPERSKWLIINILAHTKDPRVMPVIAEYLYSDNTAIQAISAQYLGESGNPTAVPLLLDALKSLADTNAVIWIVNALGKLQDRHAVEALMEVVDSTNSPVVRYTAIAALGEIGDPAAASLIKNYENDANHHVRDHAQRALRLLNHEESV